ncbi:hypothetical protein ACFX15_031640 [Malus domestica]
MFKGKRAQRAYMSIIAYCRKLPLMNNSAKKCLPLMVVNLDLIGHHCQATVACLLLKFVTNGQTAAAFSLSSRVGVWNTFVFEIVMMFGLVYKVYATVIDPKKGSMGTIAPIAIGFIVDANILASGAFDGASIGASLAGLIYELVLISHSRHDPVSTIEY